MNEGLSAYVPVVEHYTRLYERPVRFLYVNMHRVPPAGRLGQAGPTS
jgi:hypothetical protein